ncbi:MAG: peptidylprolyl isomerase [Deltaproteobacteria bacterium]|nr:peptidylprolyl isomerase [Deltaproteobacteria bacterium]
MLPSRVSSFRIMVIIIGFMAMVLPAQGVVTKPQSADKVAIVNGVPIDRGEFDGEVLIIQKTLLGFGKPLACNQVASVQMEVLESMIRREILYQESRKSGIKPDENAVNKEIKTLRQQFSNETEYKNELGRMNITEEMLRSRIERSSSVQQYVERQFAAKITVKDNDMVTYYESHLDLFKQPLQTCVSHILIQTDPKWEKSRKQEARRKTEQILKNVKKGQDFAALAREQSDGPTRTNGGDIGCVKMGQLDKQFEGTVFALKPGETTDIIETDYGFHLFKVTDKKPETVLAYENVKEKIRQFLREEKAKQEADLQAKTLREKAAVEILMKEEISPAKQP